MFMLKGFRFDDMWIRWIEGCDCGGSLSVLLNGSLTDEVLIGRRMKQGDPLTPFFLLWRG